MPDDGAEVPTDLRLPHAPPVTVLAADDQAAFRQALRTLVAATDGFQLIGEVASGEAALEAVDALAPEMVIMDKRMPGIGGVAATRLLTASHPEIIVLLISVEQPDLNVMRSCGARAFVNKRDLSTGVLRQVWRDRAGSETQ